MLEEEICWGQDLLKLSELSDSYVQNEPFIKIAHLVLEGRNVLPVMTTNPALARQSDFRILSR